VKSVANPVPAPDPQRCQFLFADGRRCRQPRSAPDSDLCISHAHSGCGLYLQSATTKAGLYWQPSREASEPTEAIDLTPPSGDFSTATEVNRALGKVFVLLAQNRIPRRNAVALGYLAQLILRTVPAVKEELISGLGYQAWRETLDSALCENEEEDDPEDETNHDNEKAPTENNSENGSDNHETHLDPALIAKEPENGTDKPKSTANRRATPGTPISALAPPRPPAKPKQAAPTQTQATRARSESAPEPEAATASSCNPPQSKRSPDPHPAVAQSPKPSPAIDNSNEIISYAKPACKFRRLYTSRMLAFNPEWNEHLQEALGEGPLDNC
jgi:hypothetical protein